MTKTKSVAKGVGITNNMRLALPLTIVPLAVAPFGGSVAQDVDGGLNARFTIGQRLQYDDRVGDSNINDEGFSTITDLGFVLSSKTRNQDLQLSIDSGLRYEINDNGLGDQFDLEDPTVGLAYSIENQSTRLSFDARYRRRDIDRTLSLIHI